MRRPSRQLIAARRGSPLLVGVAAGEYLVASDGAAVVAHTDQVIYLDDNEMAVLDDDGLEVTTIDAGHDEAGRVEKSVDTLEVKLEEIELGGFDHYMLKEIHEQPEALRTTLRGRFDRREARVMLGGLAGIDQQLARCRRVLLTGCGTAWHSCLVGEYLFEHIARVPTEVDYASELGYRNPIVDAGTLSIVISQSGETADTLAALREVKMKGADVLGIVNVVGSTIARETTAGVYTHVGAEIGVASTKAFTAQVAVLALIAVSMGRRRHLEPRLAIEILDGLAAIPDQVQQVLELDAAIAALVQRHVHRSNWLYLGRGISYPGGGGGAQRPSP